MMVIEIKKIMGEEKMIKYILKGIAITIGIFIGFWIMSKITLLGFGGSIKDVLVQFGELLNNFGDSLIKVGAK